MLPFLQEGFMSVTPLNKLENRAVRVFFLNGGDNHASCTVKVINAATGRASYTNSVVWTTSPSGEGGKVVLLPFLRPPLRPRNRASLSSSCRHRHPPLPLLPLHLPLPVHRRCRRPRPRLLLLPLHRPLPVHRRCRRPRLRPAATAAPLPQPSSNDDHHQGLLSFAGRDVLLSVLATHNVISSEREMRGV